MQFEAIKAVVKDSFHAVDELIIESLHSRASIINDLGRYIIQSGGKRLRPLVLLLIARACGYTQNKHIYLAAAVEFIHTTTLLHDDVVDDSNLRRGKKTANTVWGNEAAVLVGDFLYSKAFQMMVEVDNMAILKVLANASNIIAEGEVLQLLDRHNIEATEGGYLNVIRCKTAKLFEACAQIGALLGNAGPEIEQAMTHYGLHLGTAFQLIDDILDYNAPPTQSGKSMGTDLADGKVTLPLIHVLQTGTTAQVRLVQEAIKKGGRENFEAVLKVIETTGSIEYTRQFARVEMERAQRALLQLKPSPYRDAAYALAEFAIDRSH